jgi:uncharacterized protein
MNLRGRVVLVTGASSGIGAATAREMARKGANVLLLARNKESIEQIANEIRVQNGLARAYAVDLGDAQAVQKTAQAIRSEVGIPDVLINNAGAGRFLYVEETEPEEMVQMIISPYLAAFLITRAFLPEMIQRGSGQILNVTSPAAFFPWPGATAYSAARWAMRRYTFAFSRVHVSFGQSLYDRLFAGPTIYRSANCGSADRHLDRDALHRIFVLSR